MSLQKSILFVCLGNICRSPACEGICRSIDIVRHSTIILKDRAVSINLATVAIEAEDGILVICYKVSVIFKYLIDGLVSIICLIDASTCEILKS